MLEGTDVSRLYDAREGLIELGKADRARREYQSRAVRTPERRDELREELLAGVTRYLAPAVRLGLISSVEDFVAETEAELDVLLGWLVRPVGSAGVVEEVRPGPDR